MDGFFVNWKNKKVEPERKLSYNLQKEFYDLKKEENMSILFIEYPKCSTCKKARKWLEDRGVDFVSRHIVEENPTAEELREWHKKSGLPMKRFVNTSGIKYRELQLKDRLEQMSETEIYELLSTDGMLVKRPILIGEDFIVTGFKENEWKEKLGV